MMKDHRRNRLRLLGGAAAITLLAGFTASLGAPGLAHPHPEGEAKEHRERVIIMSHKGEGGRESSEHSIRLHRGANGEAVLPDCPEGSSTRVEEGSEAERTRIILCSRGDATPAQRAEHLQRARDRLAADSELSQEQRDRITASLDREIARLRGQ